MTTLLYGVSVALLAAAVGLLYIEPSNQVQSDAVTCARMLLAAESADAATKEKANDFCKATEAMRQSVLSNVPQ